VAQDFPNIVPPNNLRLPDALTVRHGPAPLLSRFMIEADKAGREAGIHFRLRTDFDALIALNEEQVALGNWFPLIATFNPSRSGISAENGFWVSGENDKGEIVCTNAGRIYYWPDTNLAEQAVTVWYGRDEGQPCIVTADAARSITGVVGNLGSAWVRPDYRGRGLSHLLPRICRAYGVSRWPVDWVIAVVRLMDVENRIALGYGPAHFSYSIEYPETPYGPMALRYSSADEVLADLDGYLTTELSAGAWGNKFAARSETRSGATLVAHEVISNSPEGVRQGSSSRS
jgi:GNAT superfamily N-acetyltransferase